MTKTKDTAIVPVEHIARSILILRGHRHSLRSQRRSRGGRPTQPRIAFVTHMDATDRATLRWERTF